MDTDSALQMINAKITTLSSTDKTTVFQTSRLYNPAMEGQGGEEEYFHDLRTTADTYLDAGQMLVLALIRGVKTWKFYHMDVPNNPTTITMTEVTLDCAEADPEINIRNSVGASILINAGNAAHWDLVTLMAQKAHWLGTTQGSWFVKDGQLRHSSWPENPSRGQQGGAQPASARRPPPAPPANPPRGKKRLEQGWRNKQTTKNAAIVAPAQSTKAVTEPTPKPPGTGPSIAKPVNDPKPATTPRKLKRRTEPSMTVEDITAKTQKTETQSASTTDTEQNGAAQPTVTGRKPRKRREIANAALEESSKAQKITEVAAEKGTVPDKRPGHHTWSYISASQTETVSTKLTITTDEQTVLTTTDVQSERTQLQATPTEQTLTIESNTTNNASSTVQNAQTTTTTAKASQSTLVQTTTVEGTTATGVTVTTSTRRSTSATESVAVAPSDWSLLSGGQRIRQLCVTFMTIICIASLMATRAPIYNAVRNAAQFFTSLTEPLQQEASNDLEEGWDAEDCQYWMNRRCSPGIHIEDYPHDEDMENLEFCSTFLDVREKRASEPPKVKMPKNKVRQEKNHGYEPAETWRELLDDANRATYLDKAEEFYDGAITKTQSENDANIRFYDPAAGRRTAESIISKLDEATRNHVQGGELPFTERTASELTIYIQSQAPQLEERHNATLRGVIDKLIPWSKDKKYRGGFLTTLTELCTTTTACTRAQYIRSTAAAVVRILGSTEDSNAQSLRSCRHSLAQIQRVGKKEAITSVITTIEDGLKSASPFKFEEKARFILLGFITATDWCDAMTPGGLRTADEKASALSNGDQSATMMEWRTTEAQQATTASPTEQERTTAREQWIRVKNALKPTTDSPSGIIDWRTVSKDTPRQTIKDVLFWNVDGLAKRIDEVLHVLIHRGPSVLVLTEIKGDNSSLMRLGPEKDLRTTFRELGYDCVVASTCTLESIGPGNYGVMVVSRIAPTSVAFGFGDSTDRDHEDISREGRVVTVRFANSNVTIVGAYAPCSRIGVVPQRRSLFDKLMKNHLVKEARDTHLLYMADANVAPEEHDADTSKMAREDIEKMPSCMPAERQAYRDLLQEADMVDVYRETHPVAHADDFTWHTRSPTNPQFPLGMRIDMAMCTRADYDNKFIESCEVLRYGTSDHSGLLVHLNKQKRQVPTADAENALEADPSVFPDTKPLTDYGDVVAPLVFEQLLAIRWGFEPTSDFVTRLKEEMTGMTNFVRDLPQNLDKHEMKPDNVEMKPSFHEIDSCEQTKRL
jgi:exodeoxyribonuclease III